MTNAVIAKPLTSTVTPGTGHEGQTYLVGERVYLRGIEEADAKLATSWRQTLFPISTAVTESWINEDLAKDKALNLAIVRKADDRIVGSVRLDSHGGLDHSIGTRIDPLLGEEGQRDLAEAVTLVAAWLVDERGQAVLHHRVSSCDTVLIEALDAFGMRPTARFREHLLRDGVRVDALMYEYLGARWVANLGDPNAVELPRTGTGAPRPVPPPVALEGDPPKNAIMVGTRVYLRPEQVEDAEPVALQARRETETWFDIGRHLGSASQQREWITSHEKKDPPSWVTFAVCLRENDELIGWVGLLDIDYQHGFAETGSFFGNPAYRGGGFGSEAKQLLLEYAFDRLGLHMVHSWVFFANTRSAAALRKQGYKEAGRVNWLYPHQGNLDNMVVFDLLAEEWRAMPRQAWGTPDSA